MGYLEDILTQPENLARSHETFTEALRDADLSALERARSSWQAWAQATSPRCPHPGPARASRPAFALSATELLEPGADLLGAAYVGISQSGKSAETVKGFSRVSAPRLALTNTGSGLLSELADVSLPIGSAKDAAIAILTYTATLAARHAL